MTSPRPQWLRRHLDDAGYSMVELMVSIALATILLGMGILVANTFFSTERVVDTSYTNLNQLVPIGTAFQQYIRSAVSRAPTPTTDGTEGQPIPPFGTYTRSTGGLSSGVSFSTSSLTFFTNDETDGSARIARVVATYNRSAKTFTVDVTAANPGSCPQSDTTYTKFCTFSTSNTRTAFSVDDVTMGSEPVFTYYYVGSGTDHATAGQEMPSSDFTACTSTTDCKADDIESVGVDLIVNSNPTIGHSADEETVTYQVSSTSQAYNPSVG